MKCCCHGNSNHHNIKVLKKMFRFRVKKVGIKYLATHPTRLLLIIKSPDTDIIWTGSLLLVRITTTAGWRKCKNRSFLLAWILDLCCYFSCKDGLSKTRPTSGFKRVGEHSCLGTLRGVSFIYTCKQSTAGEAIVYHYFLDRWIALLCGRYTLHKNKYLHFILKQFSYYYT